MFEWDESTLKLSSPPLFGFQAYCLAEFDDGTGPAVYVGGDYLYSDTGYDYVLKWTGAAWESLGSGIAAGVTTQREDSELESLHLEAVRALAVYDDGSGPALFVGGGFSSAGGQEANRVAKWDGHNWSPLGSGVGYDLETVYALIGFDDGSGPALYAGGEFITAGGVPARGIARWSGLDWEPLSAGLETGYARVYAFSIFDDGSGPALFAGGDIRLSGSNTYDGVMRWNGAQWTRVGSGLQGGVRALAVFDEGTGPALYAGGWFSISGGTELDGIARSDGLVWSSVGSGVDSTVLAFARIENNVGRSLYAAGQFASAGGLAVNRIARWYAPGCSVP